MKTFRVCVGILLALWVAFIFNMSAQNAAVSSATSGHVITFILKLFVRDFSSMPKEDQALLVESSQFIARKAAHFTIYGVLGALAFLNMVSYTGLLYKVRMAAGAAFCLLYAISDELHQLFIEGRSGEIRDVLIDFSGALLGILFCAAVVRLLKPLYRKVKFHE